jgi:hypothetical protein
MKKNFTCLIVLSGLFINTNAQTYYINSSTDATLGNRLLLHTNELKIGNSSSSSERAKNMLKIGDGNYIQIGEWEADDKLSFKATSYNFTNGNVGIGITNPTSKLSVNGGISSNALMIDNHQSGDWAYGFYLKVDRDLTKAFAICDKNANEVFRVYGNGIAYSKMVIAEAFEVRPDAANIHWYDNVFQPDYKLKSLYEVEKFVKENRHLPDLPSERVVKENGFNIAEMYGGCFLKKLRNLHCM